MTNPPHHRFCAPLAVAAIIAMAPSAAASPTLPNIAAASAMQAGAAAQSGNSARARPKPTAGSRARPKPSTASPASSHAQRPPASSAAPRHGANHRRGASASRVGVTHHRPRRGHQSRFNAGLRFHNRHGVSHHVSHYRKPYYLRSGRHSHHRSHRSGYGAHYTHHYPYSPKRHHYGYSLAYSDPYYHSRYDHYRYPYYRYPRYNRTFTIYKSTPSSIPLVLGDSYDSGRRHDDLARGWSSLAAGHSAAALQAFSREAAAYANRAEPKVGYALSKAALHGYGDAVWAMRRAFRIDPRGASSVVISPGLSRFVQDLIRHYDRGRGHKYTDADAAFMSAALRYLVGDAEHARQAVGAAMRYGDASESLRNLANLLEYDAHMGQSPDRRSDMYGDR